MTPIKKALRVYSLAIVFAISTPCVGLLTAAPQDETEALILQYGPDLEMFKPGGIEMVLQGWKWQLELSQVEQQLVAETINEWEMKLVRSQEEVNQLQKDLGEVGVPSFVDENAISEIHQAIRLHKGELSGLEAKLKELQEKAKEKNAQLKFDRNSMERQVSLVTRDLSIAMAELERTIQLQKKGMVPSASVDTLKVKVAAAEAELQDSREQLQLLESKIASAARAELVGVVQRMDSLQADLQTLVEQKRAIEKTKPLQKMRRAEREIAMATRMLEVAHMKNLELQLNSTRNRALIRLTEKRMAEAAKKAKDTSDDDE